MLTWLRLRVLPQSNATPPHDSDDAIHPEKTLSPQRPAQKGLRWEEPSWLGYPHDKTRTCKSGNPKQKKEKTAVPNLTMSMNTGSSSASEAAKLIIANFLWYSIFTKTCTLQNYLPINFFLNKILQLTVIKFKPVSELRNAHILMLAHA